MSRLHQDLTTSTEARLARRIASLEEAAVARQAASYRPTVLTKFTTATGPAGVGGVITMNGESSYEAPETGMYEFAWTGDTEVLTSGFLACYMIVGGITRQQVLNSNAPHRNSLTLNWGGLVTAGTITTIQMQVLSSGTASVYSGNFVIKRFA